MRRYSRIIGTGSYLPPRRLTNAALVAELGQRGIETSDEWIVERTGIRARHFAAPDVSSSDLALQAARLALQAAGLQATDIDLIIVATSTPDMVFPAAAGILQNKPGANGCPAFDLQAVCSGFVYALSVADSMVRAGAGNCALVVGAGGFRRVLDFHDPTTSGLVGEVLRRIGDFNDRTAWVLFGEGAGAVVLQASATPGILCSDLKADGKHVGILCVPGNVSGVQVLGDPVLKMDGQAVFKLAVGVLEQAAHAVLAKAGLKPADVDWLIPHQANIRIMQGTARRLKMGMDKMVVTLDQHGNTSAASIPLALDHAVRMGRVKPGQTLLLQAVGGGFTWGAVLLKL